VASSKRLSNVSESPETSIKRSITRKPCDDLIRWVLLLGTRLFSLTASEGEDDMFCFTRNLCRFTPVVKRGNGQKMPSGALTNGYIWKRAFLKHCPGSQVRHDARFPSIMGGGAFVFGSKKA